MNRHRLAVKAFCMALSAIMALTSCSNEEETFSFDDDGVPVAAAQQRISSHQFSDMVDGCGWVETDTHEILANGDYDKRDYWEGMDGASGPSRYCMKGDSISEYIFIDGMPKVGSNVKQMRYDESTNTLYADGKMALRIISVSNGWMQAVKLGGLSYKQRAQSKPLYFFVTLRKMSEEEKDDISKLAVED